MRSLKLPSHSPSENRSPSCSSAAGLASGFLDRLVSPKARLPPRVPTFASQKLAVMVKGAPDSRLLNNLIKAEKDAHDSFKSYTGDAAAASAALSAWAVADGGDAPDLTEVSMRISSLLTKCCDAQRLFLSSLSAYRTSLKDVLTRESDIRYILRDREILRSRLVKLSSKRPSGTDAAMDAHDRKMDEAQRELIACEDALRSEETALDGVKRRIFREALSMRMRSMAMLGTTWENAAKEAMERLDSLSSDPIAYQPQPRHESAPSVSDGQPPTGGRADAESIAPSHSASQVARRRAGYGDEGEEEDSDLVIPLPHPAAFSDFGSADGHIPVANRVRRERPLSQVVVDQNAQRTPREYGHAPSSSFGTNDGAGTQQQQQQQQRNGVLNRNSRRDEDEDEDDDDDDVDPRTLTAHQGGGAQRARRGARSDDESTINQRNATNRKKSGGGFFEAFGKLFSRKPKEERYEGEGRSRRRRRGGTVAAAEDDDNISVASAPASRPNRWSTVSAPKYSGANGNGWATRTDKNLDIVKRSRREDEESDDDGPDPNTLVRVVNDGPPLWRREAMSDIGVPTRVSRAPSVTSRRSATSKKSAKSQNTVKRASSVGGASAGISRSNSLVLGPPSAALPAAPVKKKKPKRPESILSPIEEDAVTAAVMGVGLSPHVISTSNPGGQPNQTRPPLSRSATATSNTSTGTKKKKKKKATSDLGENGIPPVPKAPLSVIASQEQQSSSIEGRLDQSPVSPVSPTFNNGLADQQLSRSYANRQREQQEQKQKQKQSSSTPQLLAPTPRPAATSPIGNGQTLAPAPVLRPLSPALSTSTKKSVRMAEGSKESDAIYSNTPPPPSSSPAAPAHPKGASASSGTGAGAGGGWTSRIGASKGDDSSDDDDLEIREYVKARKMMGVSERGFKSAGKEV